VPVIARDIPVFREVSSAFADYFDGNDLDNLVDALRRAANSDRPDVVFTADAVLSWKETTSHLWDMIAGSHHPQWQDPWKFR